MQKFWFGGLLACVLPLCAFTPAFAVETKTWQQADMADFEKGTLTHLALSSDGKLSLAPVVKEVFDASAAFLEALVSTSQRRA